MPALDAAEWAEAVRKALHHGVAGLLCRALLCLPEGDAPRDIIEAARAYLAHAEAEGDVRVQQTFDALDTLAADGIPALTFKGVALGVIAHESPTLRPSKDVDILVRREDMARAVASLGRLGYRLADKLSPRIANACFITYGQDTLFAAGRYPVEPHWAFAPRPLAIDCDLNGMWQRTMTLDIGARTVRTLSLEDTLLVACLHGGKEKWWRLLWVADIAALVHRHPALDWRALVERAGHAGILRLLRLGLGLAQTLFGTALPAAVADDIARDVVCRRLIDESLHRLHVDARGADVLLRVSRFHWQARERLRDRVRYVARTLTTPQFDHYRMIALPDALTFGYVAIKVVHDYVLLPIWLSGKGRLWRRPRTRISADR